MERCVKDVMSQGHDKSSAIAICHKSIMGTKKSETSLKGGENEQKSMAKKIVKNEKVEKEEEKVEETEEVTADAEATTEETTDEAETTEEATEESTEEESTDESTEEEAEAETEESKEEDEAATEEESEEGSEEAEESDEEEAGEKVADAPHQQLTGDAALQKIEKVLAGLPQAIADALKKQDAASTEEAADEKNEETLDAEEASEEEAEVEETSTEEVEAESTESEKSETSGDSSEGTDSLSKVDSIVKSVDTVAKSVEALAKRIDELEKRPAPSKVSVFSKSFEANESEDTSEELTKIETRLKEIEKIKKTSPLSYTADLVDEAFKLINRRDELKG